MLKQRFIRRVVFAITALAVAASAFLAASTSAFATVVQGFNCNYGTRGQVCAEVDLDSDGLWTGKSTAQAFVNHSVCLTGVALYVKRGPDPAAVATNNTVAQCADSRGSNTGSSTSISTWPEYQINCLVSPTIAWTAVTFQVDGSGAIGRVESDRDQIC